MWCCVFQSLSPVLARNGGCGFAPASNKPPFWHCDSFLNWKATMEKCYWLCWAKKRAARSFTGEAGPTPIVGKLRQSYEEAHICVQWVITCSAFLLLDCKKGAYIKYTDSQVLNFADLCKKKHKEVKLKKKKKGNLQCNKGSYSCPFPLLLH